jgi:hypothetical protein
MGPRKFLDEYSLKGKLGSGRFSSAFVKHVGMYG